jgi:hypothetical protein
MKKKPQFGKKWKELAFENMNREKELKKLYNSLAQENDSEAIREFFSMSKEDRKEKMKELSKRYKDDQRETFDRTWEKIKHGVLSKQEN